MSDTDTIYRAIDYLPAIIDIFLSIYASTIISDIDSFARYRRSDICVRLRDSATKSAVSEDDGRRHLVREQ